MVAKSEDWFWDGPIVRVCVSKGTTRVSGQLYNVWRGGLGVRLDSSAPRAFASGDDVVVEVELGSPGGPSALRGTLRLRGRRCHDRFLSVAVSRAFAPVDGSQEAIATALSEMERAPESALVRA